MIDNHIINFKDAQKVSSKEYKIKCPFCDANNSKARIYDNDGFLIIKCFKCSETKGLTKYLFENNLLSFNSNDIKKSLSLDINTKKMISTLPEINKVNYKRFRASNIDVCYKYLKSRMLPTHIIDKFCGALDAKQLYTSMGTELRLPMSKFNKCPAVPCIVIPYYNGDVLCRIQTRMLLGTLRYYSLKINNQSGVFNYANDNNHIGYCCEGAFDSCFINNCVATGNNNLISIEDRVLIYDNEPKNDIQMSLLNKAIRLGRKVVIFGNDIKSKDINEMVINKEIDDIEGYLEKHTYQGLKASLRFDGYTNFKYIY